MVTVYPVSQNFVIKIGKGRASVQIVVRPLKQKQRTDISSKSVTHDKGDIYIDNGLQCFLTLKHSIKDIKGIKLPNGKKFELNFESFQNEQVLTDDCVETLLNSELGTTLQFYAKDAINSTPHKIVNPVTRVPIEDVEIKPLDESKKK
jgi:hypothetical protein